MSEDSPDFRDSVPRLLERYGIHPVLLDIGASGPPRRTWDLIAAHSTFIGFDADLREVRDVAGSGFRRTVMINEAMTSARGVDEVSFFLTRSPYCSSTLEPDMAALSDYAFVDLFRVEGRATVRASTPDSVAARLALDQIDWFKTDSQGTDLRLFNSLSDSLRERVLCVEIEPGLIDAYRGEDLFVEAHRSLREQGFWLSEVIVCGTPRLRAGSLRRLQQLRPDLDTRLVSARCRDSPGWVEATYLRSPDQLLARGAPVRDYVLLWVFALMGRQWGFALDVALACEARFGADETSMAMAQPLFGWFTRPPAAPAEVSTARRALRSLVPSGVRRWIRDRAQRVGLGGAGRR